MKSLIALLVLTSAAHAEIFTVRFQGIVSEATGLPYGIAATPGNTPVTGLFKHDTATEQFGNPITNGASFLTNIASGFVWNVGGITISSSDYVTSTTNNVTNFGGSDLFQATANDAPNTQSGRGDDFRVNGIPWEGSAQLILADTDRALFPTDADAKMLPHQSLLGQIDFVWGFLGDDLGTGGGIANNLIFMGSVVPEPAAAILLAQALLVTAARARRRR
jgi:hypothetical protein